jgi:hypothetical protein
LPIIQTTTFQKLSRPKKKISIAMVKPYLGLRGKSLVRAMVISVVMPSYFMLGYNNAAAGGLLELDTFVEQFPNLDTVHTEGAKRAQNARIQGETNLIIPSWYI